MNQAKEKIHASALNICDEIVLNEKLKREKIHASELNVGDTIIMGNKSYTVGKDAVKVGFFGTTVRGLKVTKVTRVLFPKWYKGEIVGFFPQI